MNFIIRPKRKRGSQHIRDLTAETSSDKSRLIMPYFVAEKPDMSGPVESMPGINRLTVDELLKTSEENLKNGLDRIILFGLPENKDSSGSEAYNPEGIIQQALAALKKNFGDEIFVITDLCLCEYTDHGHCGLVSRGKVVNDPTLVLLARTALSHAEAGADMVAPSDMMDGRVGEIRSMLDENGYNELPIMAYSAKYSSAFYGPFREAAQSAPGFGDRKTYQMDYRNSREAVLEVELDIEEGADIVMVKPALSYLDIISRVKDASPVPVCAYNVSGEYSMVKAMAKLGWGDEHALVKEIITSIFRAGADMIISYHTAEIYTKKWM